MKINLLNIPVFYINMKKDKHKRDHIEKQLKDIGFKNITRIDAVEDKKNGRVGLSKSQYKALTQVPAPFIILEDDADPKQFKSVIDVPDDADAVYLGNSNWGFQSSHAGFYLKYERADGYPNILRVYNMLSSHAILYLSDEYVQMCQRTTKYCAEKYPMPMDVPFAMIQRFFNIYSLNQPIFIQKDYEGKMSSAPLYTNKRITEYRMKPFRGYDERYFFRDDII